MLVWRNKKEAAKRVLPLVEENSSIILFDTETTGLKNDAKVIQFSAIRYQICDDFSLYEEESLDIFINPEENLSKKVVELTGISDEVLKNAPTEDELGMKILAFLKTSSLYGAYNSKFDIEKMNAMFERIGLKTPFDRENIIDILPIARDLFVESDSHKLGDIYDLLNEREPLSFHNALDDVRATKAVLEQGLFEYLSSFSVVEEEKKKPYVKYASVYINPRAKSQIRLKVHLGEEDTYGSIYWDLTKKRWSCKTDKKSKQLFKEVDLAALESRVLWKYSWKYENVSTMDELGALMLAEKKQKMKEKSESEKPKQLSFL